MKAKLYLQNGTQKGDVELPVEVFNTDINTDCIHSVVTGYLANQRQGTAKTKGRSEVSGGGKKPFRQKGTGRARAGSNTSPLWVRGGKAFGANPRDYYQRIPKKMKKIALRSALSLSAVDGNVIVMDSVKIDAPKTKELAKIVASVSDIKQKKMLITQPDNKNTFLSGRNIKNLVVKSISDIHAYDVVSSDMVIFSEQGLLEKAKEVVAL